MALIGDDPTLCPPLGRHRLGFNFGPGDGVAFSESATPRVITTVDDGVATQDGINFQRVTLQINDGASVSESSGLTVTVILTDGIITADNAGGYFLPSLLITLEPEPFNAAPVAGVFQIAQGDTAPRLVFAIIENGYLIFTGDVLTVTAQFKLKLSGASTYTINAPLTYQNGLFIHEFTAPQTDIPGEYQGEVTLTFPDGSTMTTETFTLRIREAV
jgi:hypothetical protein